MFSWISTGASAIGGGGVLAMVLQDGGDRVVGAGAEHQRAGAGGVDPRRAVAFDQAENADAGAEPLLGMRPRAQDHIGQDGGVVADRGGLAADALMRPVAIAPVRTRHVLGDGGRPMRPGAAAMAGDPLAAMEDLDRGGGDPRLDLLADQLVRHAVVVLGDLDMVVEVDPAALPLGVFVGFGRQRLQRRPVELLEERPPAGAPAAHRPVVEIVEQGADRGVEIGQREEAPVPQPRQNPAPDHLDPDLDFRFVARLVGPRRDNGGAVMPRHVGVGPVDHRLVERGPGDAGLQIVADRLSRGAAEIGEGADMRGDPVRQLLAPHRLGVGEAGGAEHGDKDLHRHDLAGIGVDHLAGAAGEIDEQLLAGDMDLAHRRLQPPGPGPVEIAEPGIAEAVGGAGAVFLPQQRQRHVGTAQLAVHPAPIGHRALIGRDSGGRRKQQRFEPRVVEILGQRPGEAGGARPAQIARHRALAQPEAAGNRPLRQPALPAQSQNFTDLAHRQSLGRHLVPLSTKRTRLPLVENRQRRGALHHRAGLITITGIGDHVRPESVITFHRIE